VATTPSQETKVKKSWKKRLLKIFGLLFVLGLVAFVAVWIWLGNIIAYGINTMGEKVLGVKEMRVEKVTTNLLAGRFYLKGLFIGNPEGYDSQYLFKVDEVRIDINPFSWFGETFIINEIYIDGSSVIYHKGGSAGSNVDQVIKNLNDFVGAGGTKPARPKAEKPKAEGKTGGGIMEKKLIARSIVIKNMGAKLVLWGYASVPIQTGDITASNVGAPDGVTMIGLTERLLLDSVNVLEKGAEMVKPLKGAAADAAGGVLKGSGAAAGNAINGTAGAIKGLFGNGKKEEPAAPKTP
jgi:hypothetical protein